AQAHNQLTLLMGLLQCRSELRGGGLQGIAPGRHYDDVGLCHGIETVAHFNHHALITTDQARLLRAVPHLIASQGVTLIGAEDHAGDGKVEQADAIESQHHYADVGHGFTSAGSSSGECSGCPNLSYVAYWVKAACHTITAGLARLYRILSYRPLFGGSAGADNGAHVHWLFPGETHDHQNPCQLACCGPQPGHCCRIGPRATGKRTCYSRRYRSSATAADPECHGEDHLRRHHLSCRSHAIEKR